VIKMNKNVTTLLLVGATLIVVSVSLVLSILLNPKESSLPIAPTKIKASSRTYTKLIVFNRITPTLEPQNKDSQINALAAGSGEEVTAQSGDMTPTPTDVNIVITPVLTNSPTPTSSINIASVSSTLAPTKTQKLPESGIFGLSTGVFILAITFILAAFLL